MAVPSSPTQNSIVVEAYNKHNLTANATQLTQAKDEWMQEIKNDIWLKSSKAGKALEFNFLSSKSILITVKGQSLYSLPSDYSTDISKVVFDGNVRGTAQSATSSSITLSATETVGEDTIVGQEIVILSGTGAQSISQCTAYNESTKVATVTPNWGTTPDNTSGYMMVEDRYDLDKKHIRNYDKFLDPTDKYIPSKWYQVGDEDSGDFYLRPCPDKVYAIQLRYYVDLMFVDLSGTLIATFYKRARNVLVYGVYAKLLEKLENPKYDKTHAKYYDMLLDFIEKEMIDASPAETMVIKSAYEENLID